MNSQESEISSTSFYSSQIYEYDFVTGEIVEVSPDFSFPKRVISSILETSVVVAIGTGKLSWEFAIFLLGYIVFSQKKLVSFAYWLESLKDLVVGVLMWRRGLLFKPTVHGGVLVIALVALIVGGLFVNRVEPKDLTRDSVLAAENTTETLVPEGRPRSEVVEYTVAKGETLSQVASKFKVSVDSVKWANDVDDADKIKPGDVLSIPPVTGITHKVKKGETIASLAKKYEANAQTIADYPFNYITDSLELTTGQTLVIPDGKKPKPTPLPYTSGSYASRTPIIYSAGGSGLFSWPVRGSLNQAPSWFHPAIDIGAPYGSPVSASAGGKVIVANIGNYGFGNYVTISHSGGYTTTYAHMSTLNVKVGQSVAKGQLIGAVGCSGFCTGPHTHFQVSRGSKIINPLSLLP